MICNYESRRSIAITKFSTFFGIDIKKENGSTYDRITVEETVDTTGGVIFYANSIPISKAAMAATTIVTTKFPR